MKKKIINYERHSYTYCTLSTLSRTWNTRVGPISNSIYYRHTYWTSDFLEFSEQWVIGYSILKDRRRRIGFHKFYEESLWLSRIYRSTGAKYKSAKPLKSYSFGYIAEFLNFQYTFLHRGSFLKIFRKKSF